MSDPLRTTVDGEPVETWYRRLLTGDFLLWSPNIQTEAFLNWDRLWATRTIRHATPRPYPRGTGLPSDFTFESRGRTFDLDGFFEAEFLSGALLVKDGNVEYERYGRGLTRDRRWQSSSMVKSLAAILVGAAVHDGHLPGLEQSVVEWVPELGGTVYGEVRIVDLLHMASGVDWSENTNDFRTDVADHYIRAIGARRPEYVLNYQRGLGRRAPSGSEFYYNTGDTLLLSYVLSRATGMTVADYCAERFWIPMGCENDGFFMLDADNGHEVVGSCSGATLRDYAKWGTFMLDDGVALNGERIVPEGWVSEATTSLDAPVVLDFSGGTSDEPVESPYDGYGYLWWLRPDGDYQALGSYGQWIYVSPRARTVAVLLGAVPRQVYMTPDQRELHRTSDHTGSEARRDFVKAAITALG